MAAFQMTCTFAPYALAILIFYCIGRYDTDHAYSCIYTKPVLCILPSPEWTMILSFVREFNRHALLGKEYCQRDTYFSLIIKRYLKIFLPCKALYQLNHKTLVKYRDLSFMQLSGMTANRALLTSYTGVYDCLPVKSALRTIPPDLFSRFRPPHRKPLHQLRR